MKCHSCRLASETGAAKKAGFGFDDGEESSAVSLSNRRMVGEGAMVEREVGRWSKESLKGGRGRL